MTREQTREQKEKKGKTKLFCGIKQITPRDKLVGRKDPRYSFRAKRIEQTKDERKRNPACRVHRFGTMLSIVTDTNATVWDFTLEYYAPWRRPRTERHGTDHPTCVAHLKSEPLSLRERHNR